MSASRTIEIVKGSSLYILVLIGAQHKLATALGKNKALLVWCCPCSTSLEGLNSEVCSSTPNLV